MLIATAVSAAGQLAAGAGARQSAQLNAYNIETQSILNKAQAIEESNIRYEDFRSAMSSANAFLTGASGRDVDPSVIAFQKKEQSVMGKDISSIASMARMKELKYRQESLAELSAGRAAMASAAIGATSSLLSAYADYRDARTGSSSLLAPSASLRPRLRPQGLRKY